MKQRSLAACALAACVSVVHGEARAQQRPQNVSAQQRAAVADPLARPTMTSQISLSPASESMPGATVDEPWTGIASAAGMLDVRTLRGLLPAVDPARPVRAWVGSLDERSMEFASRIRALIAEIPAAADRAAWTRLATGPLGQRVTAALTNCSTGGFARRVAIPSTRPAALERALRAALVNGGWTRARAGSLLLSRGGRSVAQLREAGTHVIFDEWQEATIECQNAATRRDLVRRASERFAAMPRAVGEAAAADPEAVLLVESDERARGPMGLLANVIAVLSAVSWAQPALGPALAPEVRLGLVLQGLRESAAPVRLIADGARFSSTSVAVRGPWATRSISFASVLGTDATVAPAESSFVNGPSVLVARARESIDVRQSWLDGFEPARDAAALLAERGNARYGGELLAPPLVFVAALRARIESARPAGAPWPAASRIDRVIVATLDSDAEHPVSVALLAPSTTAAQAACALSGDRCAPSSEVSTAIRAVPGGFARLLEAGDRRAIALCAARAPLEGLYMVVTAQVGPAVGLLQFRPRDYSAAWVAEPHSMSFGFARVGARITLTLRTVRLRGIQR